MGRLAGKVALVTGGARGIGAAIGRAFVDEGATVVIGDLDQGGARATAETLGPAGSWTALDVRREADWERALDGVLAVHGRLDVLVNNAGITGFEEGPRPHDPERASLADWHAVLSTNLDGVFLGCKWGLAAMRRGAGDGPVRGSIVNLASRSGLVGIPGAAAYAASKAAVRNHTRTVALHCAEQGLEVRCNAISPAAILTPMWEAVLGDGPDRAERAAAVLADCPAGRFGRPEEVAALAVLLASDEATYMTGSELHLDGGILAGSAGRPDRDGRR